ncbi:MAG: tetratricopeptide repeat protein [Flammeovirgaceae bacterium]
MNATNLSTIFLQRILLLLTCCSLFCVESKGQKNQPFRLEEINEQVAQVAKRKPDSIFIITRPYLELANKEEWELGKLICDLFHAQAYILKNTPSQAETLLHQNLFILKRDFNQDTTYDKWRLEAKTFNELARVMLHRGQLDSVMHYADQSLVATQHTQHLNDKLTATNYKSAVYYYQGKLEKAAEMMKEMARIQEERGNKKALGMIYGNLGVVYKSVGNLRESLTFGFKALALHREVNNQFDQISALINISQIYYTLTEYRTAINYVMDAYRLAQKLNHEKELANACDNLGDVYQQLGLKDSALHYFKEGLAIYQKIESLDNEAYACERLGSFLVEEKQFAAAKKYIDRGLAITQQIDIPYDETLLKCSLVNYYLAINQKEKALAVNRDLVQLVEQSEDYDLQKTTYGVMHKAFAANGLNRQAYHYLQKYLEAADSINNTEKSREIARVEYDFELKQEKQRLAAEQEKQRLTHQQELAHQQWIQYTAIGGIVVALLIAGLIYRSYQVKKEDNKQLAHQAHILELKNEELQVLREKEQEMMDKERVYLKESMSAKERQLATSTMFSHEKNALLNQLLHYFQEMKSEVSDTGFAKILEASKLIQKNVNLQNSWENFVYQFENVHPDFFKRIKEAYPDVTGAELKIAAYVKIGLGNKEIAQVANMSGEAVKKGMYRLKKRLALEADDNLRDFIIRF